MAFAAVVLLTIQSSATALHIHKLASSPAQNNGADSHVSALWDGIPNPAIAEILVVPKMRFLFCFIPKNACTQFNRLMNELNGFVADGDICTNTDPNYHSTWSYRMPNMTAESVKALIKDPTWKKGVFLRDPLERLVSAYQSKCLPPQECGGCMNFEDADGQRWPNFDDVAQKLELGRNPHFDPQSSLCGGLADSINDFDFVGHISTDYSGVTDQVGQMLDMVLQNQPIMEPPAQNFEAHALAEKFFSSTGPPQNASHIHASTVPSDYYHNPATLAAALSHFSDDYRTLPGLMVPDWVQVLNLPAPVS